MMTWLTGKLRSDRKGAAAIEFAMLAPFLLIGMLGLFDLGYNMYTSVLLRGAIYKAARDSALEGAANQTAALDQRVTDVVRDIAPGAVLTFTRTSYTSFTDVGEPEDFTDVNGNNVCDGGEPYEDANGNASWDLDRGKSGLGGARDAVLYEVHVSYPRAFPFYRLVGASDKHTLQAKTIVRNQPYGTQDTTSTIRNCT